METVIVIVVILAASYFAVAWKFKFWPWKGKVIGAVNPNGTRIGEALARLHIPAPASLTPFFTAKKATVFSVVPVPLVALDVIDAALAELFVWYKAAYPAWSKAFTHADYAVMFINPMAQIDEGSDIGAPSLLVQGQETAGTCIGFPFPMAYIVLPHQQERGWVFKDYLFNSVFNEGEHFIESHNSVEVFNRFAGLQDSHRHIGPPQGSAVGLLSRNQTITRTCGIEKYEG